MNSYQFETFRIGRVLIDVADFLDTRIEQSTLVAYHPESDFANARFSIITVSKDGVEVPCAAEDLMRERAEALGVELHEEDHFVWYYTTDPASEGAPGSMMHYWFVGMGGHAVLVTCFIDDLHNDVAEAKRVLDSISASVMSIRRDPAPQ